MSQPAESVATAKLPLWRLGPAVFFATGFWVGFCPIAPGTVGSLWGLLLAWGLCSRAWWVQLGVVLLLFAVGIPLCTAAAARLGKGKDPGSIVWDEMVTLPLTFFLVPMTSLWIVIAGFALHRLFDITKPPPARQLERLPKGLGIMADDVAAGIYSNLVLHGLLWLYSASASSASG